MDGPLYSEFGGSDPLHVIQLWFSRLSIDNRCNATITLLTPCATLVKLPKVPETCLLEHETSLEILTFPVRHGGPHDDSSRAGCGPRAGRCAPLPYTNLHMPTRARSPAYICTHTCTHLHT